MRADVVLTCVERNQRRYFGFPCLGRLFRLLWRFYGDGGSWHFRGVEFGLLWNFLSFHSKTIYYNCSSIPWSSAYLYLFLCAFIVKLTKLTFLTEATASNINIMLVIAYKQTDRIQIPPVFLQIDDKILVSTTEEIINRVY